MIGNVKDPLIPLIGEWADDLNLWSILLRIGLSVLLSAMIGMERSRKRHSAGLRTFMLISLGGTVAMIADQWLYAQMGSGLYLLSVGAVISTTMIATNSFFISSRNQIRGITTSAGLLVTCFLGISLGAGQYTLTAAVAVAVFFCLNSLPRMEGYLKDRSNHFEVHLELTSSARLREFVTTIRKLGLKIDDIEMNPAYVHSGLSVYSVAISITREELKKYKTHREIINALATLEYVSHIEEI
ncbi:MAG: MgtC/SapB family protein [Clostridia bacterium]|nr:MgtC/SapB family protein [Clostridia bacterium]